jgi:hypothetical protein
VNKGLLLCAAALTAFGGIMPTQVKADSDGQHGISVDLAFETSDFMRHTAYRNVAKLDNDDAPSGAYGPVNKEYDETHSGKWFIELQRNGGDLIDGGIAANNSDAIARGLHILKWGFDQEQSDGSFDCPDTFHSASFFIESAAHAFLLIEHSQFKDQFQSQVDDMKPKLHKAALWMIDPDVERKGKEGDAQFTHRKYLDADALGETGILCDDSELIKRSGKFIREGIAMQDPSGYNPEKGGFDSSYHAVGVWYAERYYTIVAGESLRGPLYDMIKKAVAWEATRIADDGTVITEGNSRVGGEGAEKDRTKKAKTPAIGQIFRCFDYWSIISGDQSYQDLAQKVAEAAHMSKR